LGNAVFLSNLLPVLRVLAAQAWRFSCMGIMLERAPEFGGRRCACLCRSFFVLIFWNRHYINYVAEFADACYFRLDPQYFLFVVYGVSGCQRAIVGFEIVNDRAFRF
jgi:hypothetical protein